MTPEEEPADAMFEGDSKCEGKGNKKKDKVSLSTHLSQCSSP